MSESILPDELLRQVIAAGQVDVLVGVPTLNHAATVGAVVKAVHRSFSSHFLRQRTVLLNLDGGSKDGTLEVVRGASLKDDETLIAAQSLRTVHRISTPYHGLPGKGSALRTLFAVADLVQAPAVALFDPDVTSITPEWVERLVRPVYSGSADFVAPVFPRHPSEGPLVTQLVRPCIEATYGRSIREPLASEFACSGRFAAHCLAQDVWDGPIGRSGVDLWLTASALAGGFECAQVPLGPRVQALRPDQPALAGVVSQVAGALFGCLELHQGFWRAQAGSGPVRMLGEPPPPGERASLDPAPLAAAFRSGARDLESILSQILGGETLAEVTRLAADDGPLVYPDALWVATVYDAALGYHRGALHRDHVTSALVPLYLGRAASFLEEGEERDATALEQALQDLALAYQSSKPDLVARWSSEG